MHLSSLTINTIELSCFESFAHLKILNLSGTNLSEIKPNVFNYLDNLVHLNLSKNKISTIHLDSFKGLVRLEYLNLSFNYIRRIDSNLIFKKLSTLKHLDLRASTSREITFEENNSFDYLVNLETLELSCFNSAKLFKNLNKLNNLKLFNVDYLFLNDVETDSLLSIKKVSIESEDIEKNILRFLKNLDNLEALEVIFKTEKPITLSLSNKLKRLSIKSTKLTLMEKGEHLLFDSLEEFHYSNSLFASLHEFSFETSKLSRIKKLSLENVRFEKCLKNLLKLNFLECLILKNVHFKDYSVLCKIIENSTHLSSLNLSSCNLNEKKFHFESRDLYFSLKELYLDFNLFSSVNSFIVSVKL